MSPLWDIFGSRDQHEQPDEGWPSLPTDQDEPGAPDGDEGSPEADALAALREGADVANEEERARTEEHRRLLRATERERYALKVIGDFFASRKSKDGRVDFTVSLTGGDSLFYRDGDWRFWTPGMNQTLAVNEDDPADDAMIALYGVDLTEVGHAFAKWCNTNGIPPEDRPEFARGTLR